MDEQSDIIADALVLTLPAGESLEDWDRSGLLSREWPMYERLGAGSFKRVLVVTSGGEADQALASTLAMNAELICNEGQLDPVAFETQTPARVVEALSDCARVIVKTTQLKGGNVAITITQALRDAGKHVGLVARGGYLWSRFVAFDDGPSSASANEAGSQECRLCRAADIIIGTTGKMIDELAWRYGLARDRLVEIPNFVLGDMPLRHADERESRTVLFADDLIQRKRVDFLIEAISELPESTRNGLTLSIIGDGPDRDRLEEYAKGLGIPAVFESALPHTDLMDRMSKCSIFVHASAFEAHPSVVIEAMATGAPVVVADGPGLAGIVRHCVTGLCVPNEPKAFTHAVEGLLSDAGWREAIGSAACREARALYGLEKVASTEIRSHMRAMESSSGAGPIDSGRVQWDAGLLATDSGEAAQAWAENASRFAEELSPEKRQEFLDQVNELLKQSSSGLADASPKPRLTG